MGLVSATANGDGTWDITFFYQDYGPGVVACHVCVISPQFGWSGLGHPLFGLSGSRESKYFVGPMEYGVVL